MNIYTKKKRWKLLLFSAAIIIVIASLWHTSILVNKIRENERKNAKIWGDAIHNKADLVNYTNNFFEKIKLEERKRAELLAEAYKKITKENNSDALNLYLKIISGNTTIPVILTDDKGNITNAVNVDFNKDSVKVLKGNLKKEFTIYAPIKINYYANKNIYLYYKESKIYTELREVLKNLVQSFFSEVVLNSASVPVIITDSSKKNIITYGNIDPEKIENKLYRKKIISKMVSANEPIEIDLAGQGKSYILYKDSNLLTQLRYYPFIQFSIISLFLFIAYLLFSTARKSEQNQVWVGMAKETAHQLGTPLSSLMAWVELLKTSGVDQDSVTEIGKDVQRLDTIAKRFSKIGSTAKLKKENIVKIIYDSVIYLKTRTSKKVRYIINIPEDKKIIVPINLNLFEWVIENLCKNAVDAMSGKGTIRINITEEGEKVIIDINDTGKGISKRDFKTIFNPGYTSKQRGWGLGLSLTKRIINDYHSGKIFVKSSVIGKGTTFRIVLKRS